jgi:hypothetical protein
MHLFQGHGQTKGVVNVTKTYIKIANTNDEREEKKLNSATITIC